MLKKIMKRAAVFPLEKLDGSVRTGKKSVRMHCSFTRIWKDNREFRMYLLVSQLQLDKVWGHSLLLLTYCDPPWGQKCCSAMETCQWESVRFSLRNSAVPPRLAAQQGRLMRWLFGSCSKLQKARLLCLAKGAPAWAQVGVGPSGSANLASGLNAAGKSGCWNGKTSNSCTLNRLPFFF